MNTTLSYFVLGKFRVCLTVLFFPVVFAASAFGQASQDCPNSNFELGDFTNWTGYIGDCCPLNINMGNPGIVAGRHTIIPGPGGQDAIVNALDEVPPGFPASVRLGNSGSGCQAERLRYTVTVTPNNALFVYAFAVVLEDPGHPANEQPRFELQVFDPNGQPIACTYYQVAAGNNIPGFQTQGNARWRDWTQVGVDLSAYMGQTITIEATTADCGYCGHYGYGYLTARCEPLQITIEYCQGDTIAQLVAPDGFASYQWSNGVNGQTVVITNPTPGQTNLTCDITSVTGCTAQLSAVVAPVIPFPGFQGFNNCDNVFLFNDTSTAQNGTIVNWAWDFGDGSPIDSSQNPVHAYPSPGDYNVTLIAVSNGGCRDTIEDTITIVPTPLADLGLPGPCGLTNTFNDSSLVGNPAVINQWNWTFGTAGTSTSQNPIFTFPQPGTYDVQLVVIADNGCTDTIVLPYTTVGDPTANYTYVSDCDGEDIPFTDTSNPDADVITGWNWDFGDGNVGNGQQVNHSYSGPGNYSAQLIIQTQAGCPDTITQQVTVFPNPVADFTADSACTGDITNFSDLTSILAPDNVQNWEWTFNPGIGNSTNQNPTQQFPTYGDYTVDLKVTSNNGCVDSISLPIRVNARPVVDFTSDPLEGCQPLDITMLNNTYVPGPDTVSTWAWDMGDGGSASGVTPNYTYLNDGTYSVTLTATSDRGCDTTVTVTDLITVHPRPNAEFNYGPGTDFCLEETVFANNQSTVNPPSSIINHSWNISDGGGFSQDFLTSQNISSSLPEPGFYNVQLIVETDEGCLDTVVKEIEIFELPEADFESTPLCFWENSFLDISSNGTEPYSYSWDIDEDGSEDYDLGTFTHLYPDTFEGNVDVSLEIVDDNGCRSDTTKEVLVKGAPADFEFPNVLVLNPQFDGNDELDFTQFAPEFNECVDYTLHIYNRWGTLVFETENLVSAPDLNCTDCFRGLDNNGTQLSDGVFFYLLKSEKRNIEKQGKINLFQR